MTSLIESLSVLLGSFGINMIPFFSPSNLFIASNVMLVIQSDPFSIGFLVAIGATCAKLVHYTLTFFIGKHVREEHRKRLEIAAEKMRRWAFLAIFLAALTPIPDDPVVIPLGLLKYNPVKFTLAYFTGKLSIAIIGAFLGELSYQFLGGYLGQIVLVIISVVLTIAITVFLLKVDLSKIEEQTLKKLGWSKDS